MNEEKKSEISLDNLERLLFQFVDRVTNGKATSKTEVEVLPKVASLLLDTLLVK